MNISNTSSNLQKKSIISNPNMKINVINKSKVMNIDALKGNNPDHKKRSLLASLTSDEKRTKVNETK